MRAGFAAVPPFVLLALGLAALFLGGNSPAEAQGSSTTLMCAPGWEMVGSRCKYLSFGIQLLWRDAIYCREGTQPNPGHTRCVPLPEPDPVSPPPSSGDDDEDDEDDDDDSSDGPTGVTPGPLYHCNEGYTFNHATNRCEADSPPLAAPSVSNFRVPSGGAVDTVFPVATGGTPPYSYSLSGLPPGISFTSSTRRARGTLPAVLIDTTYTITYTVSDSAGATDSVTFTTVVTAPVQPPTTPPPTTTPPTTTPPSPPPSTTPPPPPPTPPPSTPTASGPIVKTGVNASSSRTYPLTLSHRVDVSVELTGMTTDFDCAVAGNRCTNHGGTRDDSWSGTLDAGEHKIVVYPYGGGTGNYTLTVTIEAPSTGGGTGTETRVTTLVDVSERNVSESRFHGFGLARSAEVEVALTDLTADFNCWVGSSSCTNLAGAADDSWSGVLAAGNHGVVVYPPGRGSGNYSLTVTATETVAVVMTPLAGGPVLVGRICDADEEGNPIEDTCQGIYADGITVTDDETDDDTGPPPGTRPGEGDPGPGDGGDGGEGGGGTSPTTFQALGTLADAIDCRGRNIDAGDRYGATRTRGDGTTYPHSGVDIQTNGRSAFRAPAAGTVTRVSVAGQENSCGRPYVQLTLDDGSYFVFCHVSNLPAHRVTGSVEAGAIVGYDGFGLTNDATGGFSQPGSTGGFHLHLGYRDSNRVLRNPLDVLPHDGFTFADEDPSSCEE